MKENSNKEIQQNPLQSIVEEVKLIVLNQHDFLNVSYEWKIGDIKAAKIKTLLFKEMSNSYAIVRSPIVGNDEEYTKNKLLMRNPVNCSKGMRRK